MSTKPLIHFEDLNANYKISYILTSRLDKSSLENLFPLVRGSGGCNGHRSDEVNCPRKNSESL